MFLGCNFYQYFQCLYYLIMFFSISMCIMDGYFYVLCWVLVPPVVVLMIMVCPPFTGPSPLISEQPDSHVAWKKASSVLRSGVQVSTPSCCNKEILDYVTDKFTLIDEGLDTRCHLDHVPQHGKANAQHEADVNQSSDMFPLRPQLDQTRSTSNSMSSHPTPLGGP